MPKIRRCFTKKTVQHFKITYGIGQIEGELARETISVAGITLRNQKIGIANKLTGINLDDTPFQGILGLAPPGEDTFLSNLLNSSLLSHRILSMMFSDSFENSGFQFGLVEKQFIASPLTFIPSDSKEAWEIEIESFSVGEVDYCKEVRKNGRGCRLAFDSGTSLLAGPSE